MPQRAVSSPAVDAASSSGVPHVYVIVAIVAALEAVVIFGSRAVTRRMDSSQETRGAALKLMLLTGTMIAGIIAAVLCWFWL